MSIQAEPQLYSRVPLPLRAPLAWPGGARLAFAVVVSVEHYDLLPPTTSFSPPNVPGGFGRGPYPDLGVWSRREYGNRVGLFRLLECLARHGMRATAAVDAGVAARCPAAVEECKRRGLEIAAHGKAVTQAISSLMSEEEESAYIGATLNALEQCAGVLPTGWHGPEYGESARTPALLARHGIRYVLDWPNDEQPCWLVTQGGRVVSLPMALELDDAYAIWQRRLPVERWRDALTAAVDQLLLDGSATGRTLVLNLHPWLIGQPWRLTYLDEALEHVARQAGVWRATAGEIADCYARMNPLATPPTG